jgi:hypothetical protein
MGSAVNADLSHYQETEETGGYAKFKLKESRAWASAIPPSERLKALIRSHPILLNVLDRRYCELNRSQSALKSYCVNETCMMPKEGSSFYINEQALVLRPRIGTFPASFLLLFNHTPSRLVYPSSNPPPAPVLHSVPLLSSSCSPCVPLTESIPLGVRQIRGVAGGHGFRHDHAKGSQILHHGTMLGATTYLLLDTAKRAEKSRTRH